MSGRDNSLAAYQAHDHVGTKGAILDLLAQHHPQGLCCEEIEDRLGDEHNTISASLTHLRKGVGGAVRIVRTGEQVRTRSGRRAYRVRLLEPGEDATPLPTKKRTTGGPSSTTVFHNGVSTSKEAARSMSQAAAAQETQVLNALRIERTADEIAVATGLRPQSITARLRALKARGLVVETGQNRRTRKDRDASVLRRTDLN